MHRLALFAVAALTASSASAINYDCTKPGNANKTACKAVAAPVAPAATPVAAAKREMHYDCTKAGNKNKAACKSVPAAPSPAPVAAAPAPRVPVAAQPQVAARPAPVARAATPTVAAGGAPRVVAWTTKTGKVVHYDCSKAGNLNKQACK